ncbi:hypothetical protein [Saccharopolyspora hattusasensis]|uniref:hypothetical protein n=1 Tax=Saccharopolyspora hattusasensis TaxID=1128679 RepID=UPI003D9587F9
MSDRLDEIKARVNAATPGPWGWFGNTNVRNIYLSTKYWGRQVVMDLARWGMQFARPRFARGRTFRPNPGGWHDMPEIQLGDALGLMHIVESLAPEVTA